MGPGLTPGELHYIPLTTQNIQYNLLLSICQVWFYPVQEFAMNAICC